MGVLWVWESRRGRHRVCCPLPDDPTVCFLHVCREAAIVAMATPKPSADARLMVWVWC